jgi:hypothetical protein
LTVAVIVSPTPGVAAARAALHADAEDLAGARVVGDLEPVSFWIIGAAHDLEQAPALGGRHGPALADADGVALTRVVALVVRLELHRRPQDLAVARCRWTTSIFTITVLSGLADVTTPWRVLGRPGPCSGAWSASGAGAGGTGLGRARALLDPPAAALLALRRRSASRAAIFS